MIQSHQQNPTGRIAKKFAELNGQNKTALVTFITAGDPGPDYSVPAMHALVTGGADLLELGFLFLTQKQMVLQFRPPTSGPWPKA